MAPTHLHQRRESRPNSSRRDRRRCSRLVPCQEKGKGWYPVVQLTGYDVIKCRKAGNQRAIYIWARMCKRVICGGPGDDSQTRYKALSSSRHTSQNSGLEPGLVDAPELSRMATKDWARDAGFPLRLRSTKNPMRSFRMSVEKRLEVYSLAIVPLFRLAQLLCTG